ncbi:exodeoxyribonuclease V subunit beta [Shewanella maritima]|uniref:RecBCD enzyme subunit RecB n=2 Tax=Shewanella maritima TaxID=2520507 RepID=A0A411PMQ3_9GAMM|nr:exodeoxyribonuclease V subunit beta [Shewanella maritima]QBF84758.1 exodeoxyribonuclease V subunit beta [Shewanella maritima]
MPQSAIAVKPLKPLALSFSGTNLIEASAGTGKTYTISGLYLRLLLGHGGQAPLTCEQILVVTFTNAATEELRDRIRKRIQLAFKRFIGVATDDEFIEALYQQTPEAERELAIKRFDLALKTLDEAAIYTIHGFCQRVLADMAFESSLLFESEFTLDDSEYLHHAVRDFWREVCYQLPPSMAALISSKVATPDELAKKLRPLLGATEAVQSFTPQEFTKLSQSLVESIARLKKRFALEQDTTLELLTALPLNGARFGKKAEGYPKLTQMFEQLATWAQFGQGLPPMKVLEHLSLSTLKLNKGGEIPTVQQAPLLDHIERVYEAINQVMPAFFVKAQQGIKHRFIEQKRQRNLMTPDDLLLTLADAIKSQGSVLSQAIAKRFPMAMIDEFQDTDPLQFDIFSAVYHQNQSQDAVADSLISASPALGLLMIGDPKQAIYAFRGADIYTYISARKQTEAHFNLDTNYRSGKDLVSSVNALFKLHHDPFISDAIPFDEVATPPQAAQKQLINSNESCSLGIRLLAEDPEAGLNKTNARQLLSEDAANEIAKLLNDAANNQCLIKQKPLQAKDIAVLVRDRNEAAVIKESLSSRGIGAVFLSRDSVFNTQEASDIALILQALANPKDERRIRAALACELIGYSAEQIHQFNQNENQRQTLLDQFMQWHDIWLSNGIMPALLRMASDTKLVQRLLSQRLTSTVQSSLNIDDDEVGNINASGERRLTDFRHLAELLQQKATELDGSSALINWFEQQLIDANGQDEQQLRLESEQNLVQIVTIHKSKGLEYPICFVPFVSLVRGNNRTPEPLLYHQDDQLIWDLDGSKDGWEIQKREALAEDLRLLYVALTRPVYRCYLGIANQSRKLKAGISSQLFQSAIGYLLGITDKNCLIDDIKTQLSPLAALDFINIIDIEPQEVCSLAQSQEQEAELAAKVLTRPQGISWRVGSYSGLVKDRGLVTDAHKVEQHTPAAIPGADDEDFNQETNIELNPQTKELVPAFIHGAAEPFEENTLLVDEVQYNRFTFERGANAGSFMHLVMEEFDFTKADNELEGALLESMKRYGFDEQIWLAPLTQWYQEILATPLQIPASSSELTLSKLGAKQVMVEMEFYLPLEALSADKLNQILIRYGYPAGFSFDTLSGMLKGFIDLTFEYQGKYFIADYKSNHLGDDYSHYVGDNLTAAIYDHHYHLQYILYTVALHRFLQLRHPNYDYQSHMGGSLYLFLRGMNPAHPNSGVYYDMPPQALIEELDQLFKSGQSVGAQAC